MKVLSLFDGISCGQLALQRANIFYSEYYASEIDHYSIHITQKNFPNTIQLGDVSNWKSWNIDFSAIGLILAGSPCQGFSSAGKGEAFDDPRSVLFYTFLDILEHVRTLNPDVKFLLENVKMKTEWLDKITKLIGVYPAYLDSRLVSAQSRPRVYWANWNISEPEDRGILLKDILLEPEKVDIKYMHTQEAVDYMNRTGSTKRVKWSYRFHSQDNLDKSNCMTTNLWRGVPNNVLVCGAIRTQKVDENGKILPASSLAPGVPVFRPRYDQKSNCLTTVQKDNMLGDLEQLVVVRRFTPIEVERLQTIPDNYTSSVSDKQRYKMLGNGWTVDMIVHILLCGKFKKKRKKYTKRVDKGI